MYKHKYTYLHSLAFQNGNMQKMLMTREEKKWQTRMRKSGKEAGKGGKRGRGECEGGKRAKAGKEGGEGGKGRVKEGRGERQRKREGSRKGRGGGK